PGREPRVQGWLRALNQQALKMLGLFALLSALSPRLVVSQLGDQASAAGALNERSTVEIVDVAVPATATVVALDARGDTLSAGSSFFVRRDGILITNWHVLEGASRVVVLRGGKPPLTDVRVVAADSATDVAVL